METAESDRRDWNGRHIVQYPQEVSLCAGCNACEIVCGLVHDGKAGPSRRRIFLERDTVLMNHHIHACRHCTDHPCYNACPKKEVAMCLDEGKGIAYIDPEGCIGCKLCIEACPFEPKRINFDESVQKAIKCDLCRTREKGPACVEYCQVRCIGLNDAALPLPASATTQMSAGEPRSMNKLYGYAGKIARINLTTGEVAHVSTWDYVPQFIGGRGICNKIFWDEVAPGVKAFDPENKLIFMTGPTTGTGIPAGGRTVITGIAPQSFPEQYSWSGIGGWFGAELKYAGYDGLILEGKAAKPSYIWIEDDKIRILSAAGLWGMYTYDTQLELEAIHGKDVKSLVIGPAGENLVRGAIIATANENAAGKGGYGAVFGSKNLKAVTVRGSGCVTASDAEAILKLRHVMGRPMYNTNPVRHLPVFSPHPVVTVPVENGVKQAQLCCSHGCNQHCDLFLLDVKSAVSKTGRVNQVTKCVGIHAFKWTGDISWVPAQTFVTERNNSPACMMLSNSGNIPPPDFADPAAPVLFEEHAGDTEDLWGADYDRGTVINDLCNQYGINKWDVIIWLMPWLAMGKEEGVLGDLDLGREIDPGSEAFMTHLLDMIVYRKGYYGNLLAEGMARAIRELGKEKYGDTIYKGRISNRVPGKQLDIPISFESAWGYSFHWNGRGFQGSIDIAAWLPIALMLMTSTRDSQTNAHHHDTYEYMRAVQDDPCGNPLTAKSAIMNENKAELKEALTSCDWQLPDLYWTSAEAEIFNLATGANQTEEELNGGAERIKNLFRAILIRNYGRTREMEVKEVLPMLSFPDADGRTVKAEEFNCLVDNYYSLRGWDLKTGWPTRATYEKCGLKNVADELEKLGKLPEGAHSGE